VIVTTNCHGYDNYRCDKVLIVTTNYHGYYYRCDKVVIVTTNYYAMITIDVIK
jgi:HJR/Mrr/RecB family endonuclease